MARECGLTGKYATKVLYISVHWFASKYNYSGLSRGFFVKIRKNMASAITTFKPRESFIPNPKLRLREQVHEVMRFKQFSLRTESAYWNWIRQFIFFHHKKHPREMGKAEVEAFLTHLAKGRNVSVSTQNQVA